MNGSAEDDRTASGMNLKYTMLGLLVLTSLQGILHAEKPNIVVMLSDDMGWGQVGCQGGTIIPTPNIARIASEGVSLTQFYVPFNAVHSPHNQVPKDLVTKYTKREGVKSAHAAGNVDIMDRAVGQILEAVDAKGIRDNTLVLRHRLI
jgi:arylsulfatase A-like enzyme